MAGYVKLFSDIVDSSIWDEDPFTCKVWVTLLALADPDGFVRGSPGWLAGKSRVPVDLCVAALEKFKLPDVRSRTPDFDGRRIEQLEDGWLILNYGLFRDRLSTNPQAVSTRQRVKKHRERLKLVTGRYVTPEALQAVTPKIPASASVDASGSVPGGGVGEVPSLEQAIASVMLVGIPRDFCEYVYASWSQREGRDAAGVSVDWSKYVTNRWSRERTQWSAGTHNGKKVNTGMDGRGRQENLKIKKIL